MINPHTGDRRGKEQQDETLAGNHYHKNVDVNDNFEEDDDQLRYVFLSLGPRSRRPLCAGDNITGGPTSTKGFPIVQRDDLCFTCLGLTTSP